MAPLAKAAGLQVSVTIGASFGCPFEGEVPPARIAAMAQRIAGLGVDEIALADTIGVAVPADVTERVAAVRAVTGDVRLRVPAALGDFLILRAVRASRGAALAVDEAAIRDAWRETAMREGMLLCPEGAATVAGLQQARARGLVQPGERVVLYNCASGYKYPLPA